MPTCSDGTLSSEGTSEKGMMLLSSESSMTSFSNLVLWSGRSRWSALVACTCAMRMLGSKKESGLDEDGGCAVVDSAVTRPLALVEETVGTVGTYVRNSELMKQ